MIIFLTSTSTLKKRGLMDLASNLSRDMLSVSRKQQHRVISQLTVDDFSFAHPNFYDFVEKLSEIMDHMEPEFHVEVSSRRQ